MKHYLSLTFLLYLFVLNAQNSELNKIPIDVSKKELTAKEVSHMAVFPGCENHDVNDKKVLQSCIASEINSRLGAKLENFAEELDKKGYTSAVAKLQFVIDKNGKIIQVKAMEGGNADLKEASKNALIEISNEIGKISPATLEDGTPVNLIFQLPVKYVVTQDEEQPQFEWNELVLATLKDNNIMYEIRASKNEELLVYEISQESQIFLGKYKFLNEIYMVEPYRSIYEKADGKNLITEGDLNNTFYRFYSQKDDVSKVFIYQVVNGKENLSETLNFKDFFFLPKYSELLKRN
ncbi:energy transducer TonB [Moheibacter sediminis]|uniref:TonB protein C-terminal n=1 Tax=Moheibacter sediminis TaxID=1434700 RepID=A0A1W1YI75_9FLAO|nr:hypothetical protein [Moheibacter sediminis]SMC35885.1 hypothetical protein SAMN06296427_101405 [Moheibacter sediminis]